MWLVLFFSVAERYCEFVGGLETFWYRRLQHFGDLHALDDIRLFQGGGGALVKDSSRTKSDRSIYTVI